MFVLSSSSESLADQDADELYFSEEGEAQIALNTARVQDSGGVVSHATTDEVNSRVGTTVPTAAHPTVHVHTKAAPYNAQMPWPRFSLPQRETFTALSDNAVRLTKQTDVNAVCMSDSI